MKHTKGKRNMTRSHHALKHLVFSTCSHCGKDLLPHTLCQNCGWYAGRQIVDVLAKLDKKERKKREKELHQHEEGQPEETKKLSVEESSH